MKSVSPSRWHSIFRPHVERLEDRLQPSGLQTGAAGVALTPLAQVGAVSYQTEPHTNEAHARGAIDYGTFVTGTTGTATGRAVAVDASDNQYVTGGIDDGTGQASYVKKYLADGTPDPHVPAVTLRVVLNGVTYNTEGHGIAVDPTTGNIELVGTASDPGGGNQAAFFAQ